MYEPEFDLKSLDEQRIKNALEIIKNNLSVEQLELLSRAVKDPEIKANAILYLTIQNV